MIDNFELAIFLGGLDSNYTQFSQFFLFVLADFCLSGNNYTNLNN